MSSSPAALAGGATALGSVLSRSAARQSRGVAHRIGRGEQDQAPRRVGQTGHAGRVPRLEAAGQVALRGPCEASGRSAAVMLRESSTSASGLPPLSGDDPVADALVEPAGQGPCQQRPRISLI
jgi:hypothetical protein